MACLKVQVLMLFVLISLVQLAVSKTFFDFGKGAEFDGQHVMKLLSLPQQSERIPKDVKFQIGDKFLLGAFEWSSCNTTAPLVLNSLTIAPDPIRIPGNVTLELTGTANAQVAVGLSAKVVLKKKVFGAWIEIPCTDNIGSCTYADVCSMVPPVKPEDCPFAPKPCNCPFDKGTYTVPKTTEVVPDLPVPSSLLNGDYEANVQAYDQLGNNLACYNFKISLKS